MGNTSARSEPTLPDSDIHTAAATGALSSYDKKKSSFHLTKVTSDAYHSFRTLKTSVAKRLTSSKIKAGEVVVVTEPEGELRKLELGHEENSQQSEVNSDKNSEEVEREIEDMAAVDTVTEMKTEAGTDRSVTKESGELAVKKAMEENAKVVPSSAKFALPAAAPLSSEAKPGRRTDPPPLQVDGQSERAPNMRPEAVNLNFRGSKTEPLKLGPGAGGIKKLLNPLGQDMKRTPLFAASDLFTIKLKKTKTQVDPNRETARKQLKFNKCASDMTAIYADLYVSGDMMARNYEKLKENKIKYILNLAPSVCKNYFEDKDEFVYSSMNIIDSTSETHLLWVLLRGIDFIEAAHASKAKEKACFVHCHQGVSRSGTVIIAYVMYKEHLSFKEASELVKEKHSVCSPNSGFIAQLLLFEKRLFGTEDSAFKEELFLVSPHSRKDSELILRIISPKGDSTTSSYVTVEQLDPRGSFILFLQVPGKGKRFFIWQGNEVVEKAQSLVKALEYVKLLMKYIARYNDATVVTVTQKSNPRERSEEESLFFQYFLKSSASPTASTSRKLFPPSRNSDYDAIFSLSTTNRRPSLPVASLADRITERRQSALQVTSLETELKFNTRMFRCNLKADTKVFEELKQYDVDDLQDGFVFVMQSGSPQMNSPSTEQVTLFVWLSQNVESIMNRDSAIEVCKGFIVDKLSTDETTIAPSIQIEDQGSESKEFLAAFEAGL